MSKKLLKILVLLLFLINNPSFAMKRANRPIFSLKSSLLGSSITFSHFLPTLNTSKMIYSQSTRAHFAERFYSKLTAATPVFQKYRQSYDQNEFIGPLVAGIAMGTIASSAVNNYKHVYADEDISKEQQNIEKEIIDASSLFESLECLKNKINENPSLINKYQEAALKQFDVITSNPHWAPLLKILFEDEALAQNLCKRMSSNDSAGKQLLFLITEKYSSTFTNTAAQYMTLNIQDLNFSSFHSISLIEELLASNFENRIKITSSIFSYCNNIEDIFNNNGFWFLLATTKHSELPEHYATLVAEQFSSLKHQQSEEFYLNLDSFLSSQKPLPSKLSIKLAMQNLPLACNLLMFSRVLYNAINQSITTIDNPETSKKQKISEALVAYSSSIENSKYGPFLLNSILKKNDALSKKWHKEIEQRINTASPSAIILLTEHRPCNPKIKKSLQSSENSGSLEDEIKHSIKSHAYQTTCPQDCTPLKAKYNNPTHIHVTQLSKKLVQHYRKLLKSENSLSCIVYDQQNFFELCKSSNQHLENMISQVIKKEKELNNNDYYTFIHGQKSEYLLHEQLHTFLQQLAHNEKSSGEHIALHVKPGIKNSNDLKEQKKLRKHLLQHGIDTREDERKLLFVNWAYFSNITRLGASSAYYIKQNCNIGNVRITTEDVFKINHIECLYPKYKDTFEELQKEFKSLTNFGTCILVAIPKKTVNKHIYSSQGYGFKQAVAIKNIGETDDMSTIMETLLNEPEKIDDIDQMEFCIPMTYDKKGALNPESGIKIFAFTAADQEELDAYYARQKALFEEIKKDIEKLQAIS